MDHSVHEIATVGELRATLGELRRHEKNMVIDYEDGVAVLKHREAWVATAQALKKSFEAMLEGEEDEDNKFAREAVKSLEAYVVDRSPCSTRCRTAPSTPPRWPTSAWTRPRRT